ncbi:metallophosphoesterase family protein [Zavarzinella formosa]|uniref:metallophosphoesterase family protein n=1 Tax=Zavarzinella formosa TaxID=360055 RepID=UPI0002EBA6AB|nr:metallophosphoesterase [Zavarzinella formosa]
MATFQWTRRDWLRLTPTSLLAAGMWPGAMRADESKGKDFSFLVVNDLHSLDEKCQPWFESVVKKMKEHPEKPEFLMICGDLSEDGTAKQLDPVKQIFGGVKIPVHVVPGNHDYVKDSGERPHYDDLFPKQLNYRFDLHDWQFLALDSTESLKFQNTVINPDTLKWIDDQLPKLDKKKPLVVFTHFPLGEDVKMRPKNADEILKRLMDHNLQATYSGHFHAFTEKKAGKTVLTTNRCCAFSKGNHDGSTEKGYFLVKIVDGTLKREFIQMN